VSAANCRSDLPLQAVAHRIRVDRGDYNIGEQHVADAIETLVTRSRDSLSQDRTPKAASR
jgi:hypothetical protein